MSAPAPARPHTGGAPPRPPVPWWRPLLAPAGSGLAVLLAGSAVGAVVQGLSWFGHAAVAVVVVVVAGALLVRVRPWVVAPVQLVVLLALVTAWFTGSGVLGVLPGPSAFGELGGLLSGAGDQIHTGIPPVPASPEILLLVTLAFGVLTIAVYGIAVTAESPAAAGVPLLCVFAVPTALDEQLLPWWSAVAAAAGFGVLLLMRGERLRQLPGGAAITALAVVGALLLGSAATMVGTAGRFDSGTAGGGADGSIGLNPFTSLRGQLNRPEPRDLFAVSGVDRPAYMRALTLQRYVPQSGWAAGRPLPGVGLGGPLPPSTSGPATEATAQVSNLGFRDYWLPVFGDPISITGPSESDWSYDPSGGIAYADTPQQEDGWTERMRLPTPSADALRGATGDQGVDPSYLDTAGVDPRVAEIARQVTSAAPTPFDRAMALNEYFSGPGSQFTYSLQTAPGAGGDALVEFLTRGRTGYCEQFASAMAVMLRSAGVPARVAVGFTAGRDGPDGRTISTADAHAWVEAWFPGYGWTTFDPTPLTDGRTVEPTYVQQARAEAGGGTPDAQQATPPVPESAVPPTPGPDAAVPTPEPAPDGGAAPDAQDPASGWWPVVLGVSAALVVLGLLMAAPRLLRRRQTRQRTVLARAGGQGAAGAAWAEVLAVSRDHGISPRRGDTLRTTADRLIAGHELDGRARDSLLELGRQVEASWYGDRLPEPGALDPLVADVRAGITARGAPLRARLVPASVLPESLRPDGDPAADEPGRAPSNRLGVAAARALQDVRGRRTGRAAEVDAQDVGSEPAVERPDRSSAP